MVNEETYKQMADELREKKAALERLEDLANFKREIRQPDIESEALVRSAKTQIKTLEDALRKRNIKV